MAGARHEQLLEMRRSTQIPPPVSV